MFRTIRVSGENLHPAEMESANATQLEKVRALMQLPPDRRPPDFANPLEKIEQLLTCPICFDRYKCPKLLPCQHTFCQPCLEGCVDTLRRNVKCPECRAEHSVPYDGVKAFQTNYTMSGFLDIHLQATDGPHADEIEEYVHRYNLERCKVCDEKAELQVCAHCDRRACKECRSAHSDIMRRDVARLLNQVKRLSSRVTEAADTLSKGLDTLALNCETAREDVKEYFRRYQRELHRREEQFLNDIATFESAETRLMRNLRDVLELEATNMGESTERVEQALQGAAPLTDAQLMRYKNLFQEGLDYLRNFQPDAEELFGRKLRFWPGDEASRLPTAIASFGELSVSHAQFAGRFLALEQQYVPRPFRAPLDSEFLRASATAATATATDSASIASSRSFEASPRSSGRFNRSALVGSDSDETSLRARRRQKLEEEAWNRVVRGGGGTALGADASGGGSCTGRQSPWLTESLEQQQQRLSPAVNTAAANSKDTALAASPSAKSAAVSPASSVKEECVPRVAAVRRPSSGDELSAQIEAIRAQHRLARPETTAARTASSATASEDSSSEEEEPPEPPKSRIRIICRSASGAVAQQPLRAATEQPAETSEGGASGSSPIPIAHFPGAHGAGAVAGGARLAAPEAAPSLAALLEQLAGAAPPQRVLAPPCLARRNRYQQRSHTTDAAAALRASAAPELGAVGGGGAGASRAVPSSLLSHSATHAELAAALEASSCVRLRRADPPAPPRQDSEESAPNTPPVSMRRRDSSSLRRRRLSAAGSQSLDDDAAAEWRERAAKPPKLVLNGGTKGSGGKPAEGALNWPRGVCLLRGGDIAVADSSNHRVCIFSAAGRLLRSFGRYGSGPGELDSPASVAGAPGGLLLVSDRYNHRVCVFEAADGRFVRDWGGHGPANARFNNPWGLAVDDLGTVYVVDKDNHRVQMFDLKGAFLGKWGTCGTGASQLCNPLFLAIGRNRQIYVTDSSNHRVSVFDSRGAPLFTFGSEGFGAGQLKLPRGIAIDARGCVIVADSGNNRVQVFSERGEWLSTFGAYGTAAGQLKGVEDVAVSERMLVISDRENHRLQIY